MIIKIYESKKSKEAFFELDSERTMNLHDMLKVEQGYFVKNKKNLISFCDASTQLFAVQVKLLSALGIMNNKRGREILIQVLDQAISEGKVAGKIVRPSRKAGFLEKFARRKEIKELKEMIKSLEDKLKKEINKKRLAEGKKLLEKMEETLTMLEG